jgi:hypothetical protein
MKHYESVSILLDHVADEELTGDTAKAVKDLRRWLNRKLEADRRAAEFHARTMAEIPIPGPQGAVAEYEELKRKQERRSAAHAAQTKARAAKKREARAEQDRQRYAEALRGR